MVSINPFTTVNSGSVDGRSGAAQSDSLQREERIESDRVEGKRSEDAAVTSVSIREERFLRDPDAATALANSIASRLANVGLDRAVEIQGNSRPGDVQALLS